MAEVYDTQPKLHRSGVTAVDTSNPADTSGAIDSEGYKECRFDITITGTDFTSLETQVIFWNPRQEKWFSGGSRTFTATGQHRGHHSPSRRITALARRLNYAQTCRRMY